MGRLEGKKILVSGAASGLGRAGAVIFAKEGADVAVTDINVDGLNQLLTELKQYGGNYVAIAGDATIEADVNNVVDKALAALGRIDCLLQSAGVSDHFAPVANVSNEEWNRVISINLTSNLYWERKLIPIMIENGGGNIVNVSSVCGLTGGRAGAAYVASKWGLIGLTKNTARMYGRRGIRCNAICPGGVASTNFMTGITPDEEGWDIVKSGFGTSLKKGTEDQIANTMLFLASDESDGINGYAIAVDNGSTAF
ncbi:MAG: SDR family oxidoreductase [Oscillospiraceae bacterium]|nr:SDR family oxidoreductase [Oscillospiraceae bacterium]